MCRFSKDGPGPSLCVGFAEDGAPRKETISIELTDAWDDAFDGEHSAFANAIASNKLESNAGTGEDGRLVQQIVESVYGSNELRKEIAIK